MQGNLSTTTDAAFVEKGFFTIDPIYVVASSTASGISTYQNNYGNPPYNNNPNSNTTANSAKLYQMNSSTNKTGLSMSLKVMAGDTLNIFGKSYFSERKYFGWFDFDTNGESAVCLYRYTWHDG